MREKIVEHKLTEAVKAMRGIAPKFVSPGFDGMPDRLVLLPDGKCGFVEVERLGEKPRPLQEVRHGMLRRLSFVVQLGILALAGIIMRIGYFPMDIQGANLFFQLITKRYEKSSTILTSNKVFSAWNEVFSDITIASAILDRVLHHYQPKRL